MFKYIAIVLTAMICSASFANNIPSAQKTYKTPVIIDTDMGFDDWMALLYAAKDTSIDIKAVTIDCSGETYCPQGAENATKLLKLATGKANIPVFVQKRPLVDSWYSFSQLIRDGATEMQVNNYLHNKKIDFKNLEGYPYNTKISAAQEIVKLATEADEHNTPLTFISIGSAVNLSRAINLAKSHNNYNKFKHGFKMVYKGGGAFGMPITKNGDSNLTLSNIDIKGNISIPSIYSTNNNQAEWNIYAAASQMENLVTSGLPLTFIPLNVSDKVKITEESYNQIVADVNNKDNNAIKFVADDIITQVNQQGGWSDSELDYWDPSVMVLALNPSFATEEFKNETVCIASTGYRAPITVGTTTNTIDPQSPIPVQIFESQNTIHTIYQYGSTLVNTPIDASSSNSDYSYKACELLKAQTGKVNVMYNIDTDKFYSNFINTLNA